MRDVYPGFLQLNGFMTMNLDRHIEAHRNLFKHLVSGDGNLRRTPEVYDEYLASWTFGESIATAKRVIARSARAITSGAVMSR